MVHKIRDKNILELIQQTAKEIGPRTFGAYAFMGIFIAVIAVTFLLSQQRQNIIQQAAGGTPTPYTFTFDGDPTSPEIRYWMDDFDIQVHSRDAYNKIDTMSSIHAQHGSDCSPPPAAHLVQTAVGSVYNCKNHLMTAIEDGGYGVIYLTPNRILDWSDGEATLSIDVSTLRMSGRDWWDIWLTEWDAEMALPLSDKTGGAGTDLQGPPEGEWARVTMNFEVNEFFGETHSSNGSFGGGPAYSASSATQRDNFQLTINSSTFSFCKPGENICWVKDQPHNLTVKQAVVQIGHHTYNATKAVCCQEPGTWHWDNLYMSDSIPFTIIRANERSRTNNGTFTFRGPAPANAFLRFSAIGDVKINGQSVNPQVPYYSVEHFNSYKIPIAQGTTSVTFSGTHPWGLNSVMKDVSIFSLVSGGTTNPTNTPIPQPTGAATPTLPPQGTPSPTQINLPTLTPTPIVLPTATPTRTPTPLPPTATPVFQQPTPTPTPIDTGAPGLTGTYYNNSNFSAFALSRIDSSINFDWKNNSPASSIGRDTFSALWTGSLMSPKDDWYTIYTRSDDGVRVYIDNNLLINNWTNHGTTENSSGVFLTQGRHQIRVEYYENTGKAVIGLLWSSPSISKQTISSQYLRTQ